jgi:hypothetical protein
MTLGSAQRRASSAVNRVLRRIGGLSWAPKLPFHEKFSHSPDFFHFFRQRPLTSIGNPFTFALPFETADKRTQHGGSPTAVAGTLTVEESKEKADRPCHCYAVVNKESRGSGSMMTPVLLLGRLRNLPAREIARDGVVSGNTEFRTETINQQAKDLTESLILAQNER